jgi:putative peptidoglycan lipid II flippase
VICTVLAFPVIALAFQHNKFHLADAQNTAEALRYYAPGLAFAALDQLLIFAFYAKHDTKTPVVVGVISIGFYLAVALATLHPLSFRGLALADAAKQISHATILYVLLRRWQGRIEGLELRGAVGKVIGAGAAMGLVCYALLQLAGAHWMTGTLHLLAFLIVAGGAGTAAYLLLLYWWGLPELLLLFQRMRSRLGAQRS